MAALAALLPDVRYGSRLELVDHKVAGDRETLVWRLGSHDFDVVLARHENGWWVIEAHKQHRNDPLAYSNTGDQRAMVLLWADRAR